MAGHVIPGAITRGLTGRALTRAAELAVAPARVLTPGPHEAARFPGPGEAGHSIPGASRARTGPAGEAVERVKLHTGAWVEHAGKLAQGSRPAGRAPRLRWPRAEAAGNRATGATGSSLRPPACQVCGTGSRPIVPALWHNAQEAAHRVEAREPAKLRSCSTGADSVPAVWHEARIEAW